MASVLFQLRKVVTLILITFFTLNVFAADLLDNIKARGTLRVAMEGNYPPFNFKDPSGQLNGFEVALSKLLAEELGVKAEFTTTEWSGILAGLAAGKYDIIVNQVGITPERQKTFDFSEPYTLSKAQLILRENDQREFHQIADLNGLTLGVAQGSNFEQKAKALATKESRIKIKTYPGAPEYLAELANGRIDAALNDRLLIPYLIKTAKQPIKAGSFTFNETDTIGIPFKKDNPKFAKALNDALQKIYHDGRFKQLSDKWFGFDVSKP